MEGNTKWLIVRHWDKIIFNYISIIEEMNVEHRIRKKKCYINIGRSNFIFLIIVN